MRIPILLTSLIAILTVSLLLGGAWLALHPRGPALVAASFSHATITPNADGNQDVTRISYQLQRPATLSIYFLDQAGQRFYFRRDKPREAGEHQIDFSGIVDPYHLPSDRFPGEIQARVLPEGEHTWVIEAQDGQDLSGRLTGTLTLTNADASLPELLNLTVSPDVFTPNQDGLDDRANINIYLTKEIDPDGLHAFLIDAQGVRLPIAEKASDLKPGQRGLHAYDYDGGIDLGVNPPADGTYTVRVEAADRLGQKTAVTGTLAIAHGGLPRAEILNGEVNFSATTLVLGQTLYFTLTVENYGAAPIRTSGPDSGWIYDSMNSNANTLGKYEESGAWRVGIDCDTCIRDYPWRWALGTPQTLTPLTENGQIHYYLMPGQRATVTGGIVLDNIVESRNPQYFWAGLIHEDVEISAVNNGVGREFITLVPVQ